MITFNIPYLTGNEINFISEAFKNQHLSGNGPFTKKCQEFFEKRYNFKKVLLTTSCTDALEMCAILANISQDDEVIIPSFTFVSTPLAFVRQGAKIIFADSYVDNPNINIDTIESLISKRTKAIVVVHYAGFACDMDKIMNLANKYNLLVIEDAAHAIDSFYNGKPLGSIGHLAAFSFHETKNIISGEGGMLVINDERFVKRSEIIWEKGTNRAEFFRGEINKYGWVDKGSSFLPSEIIAAFLWAQLEKLDIIQKRRKEIWQLYFDGLKDFSLKSSVVLPSKPNYASCNGHLFYLICPSEEYRTRLISYLSKFEILAVSHYLSLHSSSYYNKKHDDRILVNADNFTNCLIRLPLFYQLTNEEIDYVVKTITNFN
jgi:dTDP-4-amino-4,6-dideoxygalactose transaminase